MYALPCEKRGVDSSGLSGEDSFGITFRKTGLADACTNQDQRREGMFKESKTHPENPTARLWLQSHRPVIS
jgi:hypothetical protein